MSGDGRSRRVLLVTMDFPPTRGGIQTMAREIVTRATRSTFRVVAPADPGHETFDATFDVPVRRMRAIGPGRRGFVPTIAAAAAAEERRFRPDVVLCLHVLAAAGPMLLGRAPVVVVCHGGELRSARIRSIARRVLPRAERIVANSRYTRTAAVAAGADPMRTSVLGVGAPDPVAVPQDEIDAVRRRAGGRYVLSVGRLAPHKGHDTLIRALPGLPADVRLVIVGDGEMRPVLQQAARDADVTERVLFAGSVGDDELAAWYAGADTFALLSRETAGAVEGAGIVLLEACAYGVPVVAARTGGIPETIRDAETGLLVDPDDASAVVRVLRRSLEDRELARRLGEAARAMAAGERSWTAFVERMETVLDLASRRSREVV